MLFVEFAKAKDGWLWHSGRIDNKPELEFGCFCKLVVERVKGWMESTNCELEANAICDSLLGVMIAVEASWNLAPSFFWTRGRWDSLSCDGWLHCHGTYSMEV
jgi:hypothetical protein